MVLGAVKHHGCDGAHRLTNSHTRTYTSRTHPMPISSSQKLASSSHSIAARVSSASHELIATPPHHSSTVIESALVDSTVSSFAGCTGSPSFSQVRLSAARMLLPLIPCVPNGLRTQSHLAFGLNIRMTQQCALTHQTSRSLCILGKAYGCFPDALHGG